MTVAAVVPMVCYLAVPDARGSNAMVRRSRSPPTSRIWVSQFTVLALSRARELAADHWSCECTGDGDALASALVKIALRHGRGARPGTHRGARAARDQGQGRTSRGRRSSVAVRSGRCRCGRSASSTRARRRDGRAARRGRPAGERCRVALGRVQPVGRACSKLASTHPLVAHRIDALAHSELPGAPREWACACRAPSTTPRQGELRRRFEREARRRGRAVGCCSWPLVRCRSGHRLGSARRGGRRGRGCRVLVQAIRALPDRATFTPSRSRRCSNGSTPSPVAGIPVEVRGRVIGRGIPGYVLSPDLVIADDSGFVPLAYRQPVPFVATLFGLLRVPQWLGRDVVARGLVPAHAEPGDRTARRAFCRRFRPFEDMALGRALRVRRARRARRRRDRGRERDTEATSAADRAPRPRTLELAFARSFQMKASRGRGQPLRAIAARDAFK